MKILAALALFLCITTAQADLSEDAFNAYIFGEDYAEAMKLLRLSAEQGDDRAQYLLGLMYEQGQGTPQNYADAMKWYRLAAEQGYANAQFNLGSMYVKGHAVPQDYIEAHKWFNLAASRHTKEERRNKASKVNKAIRNRDSVANKMTTGQVAEAQKLAKQWDKAHPR